MRKVAKSDALNTYWKIQFIMVFHFQRKTLYWFCWQFVLRSSVYNGIHIVFVLFTFFFLNFVHAISRKLYNRSQKNFHRWWDIMWILCFWIFCSLHFRSRLTADFVIFYEIICAQLILETIRNMTLNFWIGKEYRGWSCALFSCTAQLVPFFITRSYLVICFFFLLVVFVKLKYLCCLLSYYVQIFRI